MNYQTHERVPSGIYIRALRQQQGLSQTDLAIRVGIRQSNISRIESGKLVPRMTTLAAIAGVLGVVVDDLMVWREKEPNYVSCTGRV